MNSYNHKKQLPLEISFGNFVKVYFRRFAILIGIVLINFFSLAISYLFILVFSGSKISLLIVENLEIFYAGIVVILIITLITIIINFNHITYYVQRKFIERRFESTRKLLYKRVAADLNYRLKENNTLSLEEKYKLEKQLNQSVSKLDLKMMLKLYCIIVPEESQDIHVFC